MNYRIFQISLLLRSKLIFCLFLNLNHSSIIAEYSRAEYSNAYISAVCDASLAYRPDASPRKDGKRRIHIINIYYLFNFYIIIIIISCNIFNL